MTKKSKCILAVSVLLLVVLVAGISVAVATSSLGSKDDPLVTMSYLNQTVKNDILNQLDSAIDSASSSLSTKLDGKIAGMEDGANTFTAVTLSDGQVLRCDAGTEILLRAGSAVSAGDTSPRLIDETDGAAITASGAALSVNHLYMASSSGNGVKAAGGSVTLLVRGSYTID